MKYLTVASFGLLTLFASPAQAQDARAAFEAAFGEACMLDTDSAANDYFPDENWTLTWQEEYSDADYSATLYQFFCFAGAYNVNSVFYVDDPHDGLLPLSFAAPHYDIKYENDDYEGAVESITLRGFDTRLIITNAQFDPDTNTITDYPLWRGMGDASSSGRWVFDKGDFVLKSFDVDATYDGESNPKRIVEYK